MIFRSQKAIVLFLGTVAAVSLSGCFPNTQFMKGIRGEEYALSAVLAKNWSQDGSTLYAFHEVRHYKFDPSPIITWSDSDLARPSRLEYVLDAIDLSAGTLTSRHVTLPPSFIGKLRQLFGAGRFFISPNGQHFCHLTDHVAHVNRKTPQNTIHMVDLQNGALWKSPQDMDITDVAWSPDGTSLFFQTDQGIFETQADDSTATQPSRVVSTEAREAFGMTDRKKPSYTVEFISYDPADFRMAIRSISGDTIRSIDPSTWQLEDATQTKRWQETPPCQNTLSHSMPKKWDLHPSCSVDSTGRYLIDQRDRGYAIIDTMNNQLRFLRGE